MRFTVEECFDGCFEGDRAGPHSIRLNDQFRLCFRWADTGAEDVEIADYY